MRKIITSALAAVTAAGAVLATAAPAQADRYRHHRNRNNDDAVAAAVIGGVAGLALGAALSNGDRRRDRGYYDRRYYDNGYRYDPRYDSYRGGRPYAYYGGRDRYRTCISRDRVYDPYIGRRVTIERRYAC